jgi:hypothetical protein
MKEILDHEKKDVPVKKRYAILSFVFALITSNLLILLWNQTPAIIRPGEGMPQPSSVLVIAAWIACFLGVACTIISIFRKERWGFYKVVGLLINAGLLIFILSGLIFSQVILW